MESSSQVQTSLAAAMTLGLKEGNFYRNARLRALNYLLTYPQGCSANCSYCGLSKSRKKSETFIRVSWPTYPLQVLIERSREVTDQVHRVCVSMVTHPKALADLCAAAKQVREQTPYPVSALITPTLVKTFDQMEEIRKAGVDRVGIAIDTATPELFDQYRGKQVKGPHSWEDYWRGVRQAVEVFGPGRVGIHLVVGLGETEQEMVSVIQEAQDLGALTHLFSFFPERGTALENHPQPPLGAYRRIQLARYLINHSLSRQEKMKFNEFGQITEFGLDKEKLEQIISEGEAFMTSGCPGLDGKVACNRPYGNERPSQPIRNFPFPPEEQDRRDIREQLAHYEKGDGVYERGEKGLA